MTRSLAPRHSCIPAPGASAVRTALATCTPAPCRRGHAGERAQVTSPAARDTPPKAVLEQSPGLGNRPLVAHRHPTACKAKTRAAPKHKTPSQTLGVQKNPPVSPPPHPPGDTRGSGSSRRLRTDSQSHGNAVSLCLSAPKSRAGITGIFHPAQSPGQEIKK